MIASDSYDLVILGAGSGGLACALRAAKLGARVALVEPHPPGGTCVHRGCVPKKAMWLAAELAGARALSESLGFSPAPVALDWVRLCAERTRYIERIEQSYRRQLDEHKVALLAARGELIAPHTVQAGARTLRAPHTVLAIGGRARRPSFEGAELGIDSDGFFALRSAPARVAVVGGGYIAVELGSVLHRLGSDVTLLARGERLLPRFDQDAVTHLQDTLRAHRVHLELEREVWGARRDEHGLWLNTRQAGEFGPFDEIVWATGRTPNSDALGLRELGVALGDGGHVLVDAQQNTSVSGLYAVGDLTEAPALTPVAVRAGRALAERLFGGQRDAKLALPAVPTVMFAHPPLATVGASEAEARAQHGDAVRVHSTRFRPMLGALADRPHTTFMKLVCVGAEERVVGVHLVGPQVDEMLQGFAVALSAGATKAHFDATLAIHPTASEELVLLR